jgi:hypothetical protein
MAEEIFEEAKKAEGPRPADHILAQVHELPPEDEERVADAIAELLARRPQARRSICR